MLQRARAPGTPADGSVDGGATAVAMAMRGKRQRAAVAASAAEEEPLLAVDPSLMTERQQLAFLLRATAHEASASDSPASDDGGSADERRAGPAHPRKKPRRPAADAQPRGRGRPPRRPARPARASPRTPRARPAAPAADGENDAGAGNASPRLADARRAGDRGGHDLRRAKKPPAAASAGPRPLALRNSSSSASATAFAAEGPTCALCGHGELVADALFLCPACDRKYPTQQALGRMCMT